MLVRASFGVLSMLSKTESCPLSTSLTTGNLSVPSEVLKGIHDRSASGPKTEPGFRANLKQ